LENCCRANLTETRLRRHVSDTPTESNVPGALKECTGMAARWDPWAEHLMALERWSTIAGKSVIVVIRRENRARDFSNESQFQLNP